MMNWTELCMQSLWIFSPFFTVYHRYIQNNHTEKGFWHDNPELLCPQLSFFLHFAGLIEIMYDKHKAELQRTHPSTKDTGKFSTRGHIFPQYAQNGCLLLLLLLLFVRQISKPVLAMYSAVRCRSSRQPKSVWFSSGWGWPKMLSLVSQIPTFL